MHAAGSRRRFDTHSAPDVDDETGQEARHAQWAVLSRDDVFADSLAGTPLTGDWLLLLTASERLDDSVRAELMRVLGPGETVYLLGGEAALSSEVEAEVRAEGLVPERLAGASREATAGAVALEVVEKYGPQHVVFLARSDHWADSITIGSYVAGTKHPGAGHTLGPAAPGHRRGPRIHRSRIHRGARRRGRHPQRRGCGPPG